VRPQRNSGDHAGCRNPANFRSPAFRTSRVVSGRPEQDPWIHGSILDPSFEGQGGMADPLAVPQGVSAHQDSTGWVATHVATSRAKSSRS
jgi:hypothetical protein